MSEEDVRKYLSRGPVQSTPPARPLPPGNMRKAPRRAPRSPESAPDTYKDFSATHLFCPTCKQAMPVREKLMLFLSDGDLYDYACVKCGTSVGTRKAGN